MSHVHLDKPENFTSVICHGQEKFAHLAAEMHSLRAVNKPWPIVENVENSPILSGSSLYQGVIYPLQEYKNRCSL